MRSVSTLVSNLVKGKISQEKFSLEKEEDESKDTDPFSRSVRAGMVPNDNDNSLLQTLLTNKYHLGI